MHYCTGAPNADEFCAYIKRLEGLADLLPETTTFGESLSVSLLGLLHVILVKDSNKM